MNNLLQIIIVEAIESNLSEDNYQDLEFAVVEYVKEFRDIGGMDSDDFLEAPWSIKHKAVQSELKKLRGEAVTPQEKRFDEGVSGRALREVTEGLDILIQDGRENGFEDEDILEFLTKKVKRELNKAK